MDVIKSKIPAFYRSKLSNLKIEEIILNPLPDGGCAVRWGGSVTSSDGGDVLTGVTQTIEFKAAINQSRCDALKQAGEGRLAKALRLQEDGGVP